MYGPWQASSHSVFFSEHVFGHPATSHSASDLILVQWLYVRLRVFFLAFSGPQSNVIASIGSLQRHRMPLRARRPSATSSNWTRHDAPAAGKTSLSCVGKSRSMRRTENVRNPPAFEVLRANGACRPHLHSTLRSPNSSAQHPATLDRRLDRLSWSFADHPLAPHYD